MIWRQMVSEVFDGMELFSRSPIKNICGIREEIIPKQCMIGVTWKLRMQQCVCVRLCVIVFEIEDLCVMVVCMT